ncbi:MAG: PTS sugar transporter subunit IIB [Anaerolineae bacterium]|nr:PTS sugar transporter subunit IIB [Anaerolineae bacterium]
MNDDWALFRIDDRLIHGQIVTVWIAELQIKRILIIDDVLAEDLFLQNVYRYSAPPSITIDICSIKEGPEFYKSDNSTTSTMVIVRSPAAAMQLFEIGFPLKHINIGALGSTPERERYYKNISISTLELETLRKLQEYGIRIYFQRVPSEPPKSLEPS